MGIRAARDVDAQVARMVEFLRSFEYPIEKSKTQPFVTISREYGCEAFEVAQALVEGLDKRRDAGPPWQVYDRNIIEIVAHDSQISERIIESMAPAHRAAFDEFQRSMVLKMLSRDETCIRTARVIKSIAWHGRSVIIGRGGYLLCSDMEGGFHVQIVAPRDWRMEQTALRHNFGSETEAYNYLDMMDRARRQFFCSCYGCEAGDRQDFDLVIDNSRSSPREMVEMIISGMTQRGLI